MIPQYLDKVRSYKRTYGTLENIGEDWMIKAEPYVLELVRRIFPATSYERGGIAIIPNNKRFLGDLNWLMMRYPLKIKSKEIWKKSHQECVDYVKTRDIINTKKTISKNPVKFNGELMKYQKQGLTYLFHNKRCLLADEMGLGKTVQALALISKTQIKPILIIAPPHLLAQWDSEIKRFLGPDTKIQTLTGLTPYKIPDADIYMIHYLLMRGWEQELIRIDFDIIIFDEVQELRHTSSSKYNSCKTVCESLRPEYIIGLSGTPFYNLGGEMFNILDIIEKGCLGTKQYFKKEWCDSWSNVIKDPKLFGAYLKEEGLMLRRKKDDVLTDLPDKLIAKYKISYDDRLYLDLSKDTKKLVRELPFVPDREKGQALLEVARSERRATGISKAQEVAEFVKLLLLNNEPVLLFGYHRSVIGLWADYLSRFNPKMITGDETKKQKEDSKTAFMNGETNLLILNLRTSSGLNLQRARCVVFGELDYSPAVHLQCQDRAHRLGQKQKVVVYYLYAPLTFDEEIMMHLKFKETQFNGVMQDKEISEEEFENKQVQAKTFMWNMVDRLMKDDKK